MTEGCVVWITGLPASGKSTLAEHLTGRLRREGVPCCTLDSDIVRNALAPTLGYDDVARDQFYEMLGNLAVLLSEQGLVVLVPATAHRREYRDRARAHARRFLEVWVDVGLEECRRRDSKGLYAGFAQGRARSVPGEDVPYEEPSRPDVVARGGADEAALEALTQRLVAPA